jgi:hypothetical protein
MMALDPQTSAQLYFTLSGLNLLMALISAITNRWTKTVIEFGLCVAFFIFAWKNLKKHRAATNPGESDKPTDRNAL